jgi:uncharacterized membrane protein YphA (DoxX/SURF4 family)
MRSGKLEIIGYWVATVLVAIVMGAGGAFDAAAAPKAVEFLAHLGYPAYFVRLIGVWKVLGTLAILAPRWPRLKEWAYAGMFFDLTGAAVSHAASGDGPGNFIPPLLFTGILIASWALRPASRKTGP